MPAAPSPSRASGRSGGFAQPGDGGVEVVDFDREAVPAAGALLGTIRHRLPTSTDRIRCAEHEAQSAAREHREGRGGVHHDVEPELLVEADGGVDVVDDVAYLYHGHRCSPFRPLPREASQRGSHLIDRLARPPPVVAIVDQREGYHLAVARGDVAAE